MLRSAGCCARPVSPRVRQFDVKGIPSLNATYLYIGFCTRSAIVIFAVPLRPHYSHHVEIPAVQSQQQSPSVGNAKKKKVHIYAYTS